LPTTSHSIGTIGRALEYSEDKIDEDKLLYSSKEEEENEEVAADGFRLEEALLVELDGMED
jgi:hypothetical protein